MQEAEQAQEYTLAAAQTVGTAFQKEQSMPPEQHAASAAIDLNTNTVLHTTQTRNPQGVQPKLPDIMKAEMPGKLDIPTEPVDLPTKEGGVEANLPSGERVTVNPTEAQIKDIDKRTEETKGAKTWSEIIGTKQWTGTIVKTDERFNTEDAAWKQQLQQDNPTWTGEYVYLDLNDKGKIVPKAYNPSEVFKTAQGANVGNLQDVTVGTKSKQAAEISDEDAQKFSIGYQNEPWQTQALMKDNLSLTKFVMKHPDLLPALRKEAEQFPSNYLASESGRSKIVEKAVEDIYGGDQQVPTSVLQAVQSYNYWNAFKNKYQSEQTNISAKMKAVGEVGLKTPEMDEMLGLEAKKLNDPASMTDEDRRRYAELKVNITNAVIKAGQTALPDLWNAYQVNTQSFITASKQVAEDMQVLGTKEGQDGLALYIRQKKGQELAGVVPGLFPEVTKAKEAERKATDEKYEAGAVGKAAIGVRDFGKSIYTGMVGGVDDVALAVGGMFGSKNRYNTAKLLSNGGSFEETPFAQVALNKEGYKPFYAQAGEMLGNMAPALLMGQFAKAPELGYFMLGTYNQGYQEAKLGGANEMQAQTIGAIKGGLMGLFMKTIQMPSDLAKATVGRMTTEDLIKTGFTKKGLTDYIMKFLPTEQGAKSVAMLNVFALATDASNFVVNSGSNKLFGTHLATDQLDINNIAHDVAMNTVVGGMITGVSKLMPEAKGARMELLRNFDRDPALYVGIMEEARKNAAADGDFKTLAALDKAKEFIGNSWAKEGKLPKGLTPEQKTASLSIWDEIAEQESVKRETDPVFHEPIDAKLKFLHDELKEVVASHSKAEKMIEKETTPVQEHLQETVLKPVEPIEEIKPEVKTNAIGNTDTIPKPRNSKITKEDFQEKMLHFAEDAKDSQFEYRLDMNDMQQKDREGAVKDIRAGKTNTKRAQRLQAHIDRMWEGEHVSVNRGRGNHAEARDIPFKDWFGEHTPEEANNEFSQLTPEQQSIAEQDYETEQQLTDEYWKQHAETDGFAEKADNTKAEQDARAAEIEQKRQEIEKEQAAAPEEEKAYHEQRKQLLEKYGHDVDDLIDRLKKEDRLEVKCPPAAKKRFSLRNLFKRS